MANEEKTIYLFTSTRAFLHPSQNALCESEKVHRRKNLSSMVAKSELVGFVSFGSRNRGPE